MTLKCKICGAGPFKKKPGLLGHIQFVHGTVNRRDNPGQLTKEIQNFEKRIQSLEAEVVKWHPTMDSVSHLLKAIDNKIKSPVHSGRHITG